MSIFELYLKLGIDHILDFQGYDHILFVITLCSNYSVKDWKKVLILITAFTIGHSLTLVLATLNLISISTSLVEFLIPLTIFVTALFNVVVRNGNTSPQLHRLKYIAALFFGLIHGLGFSNYLRSLLGQESNLVKPLFAFNVGIEIGQLIIVVSIMAITWLIVNVFRTNRKDWNLLLAGAALGVSLILILERVPW